MIKNAVEMIYEQKCKTISDINEHLPTIKKYCDECESAYELGVRNIVSSWAFAASNLQKFASVDLIVPKSEELKQLEDACKSKKIDFKFLQKNSLDVEAEEVDLTFIDTWHVYDLCIQELNKYSKITKKYIILHDTTLFGESGEQPDKLGLNYAVREFLENNKDWKIKEVFSNNNGLTVLQKI